MQPWESWQRDALTIVVMIAFAIIGTVIVVYIVHEVRGLIERLLEERRPLPDKGCFRCM